VKSTFGFHLLLALETSYVPASFYAQHKTIIKTFYSSDMIRNKLMIRISIV